MLGFAKRTMESNGKNDKQVELTIDEEKNENGWYSYHSKLNFSQYKIVPF